MALTKIPSSLLDTSGGFDLQGNITLGDSEKILLGASSDLQIYHDESGGHSRIDDTGTGGLVIRGSQVLLEKYGGGYMINAVADGASELYHSGSKKFETTSTGATVTGNLAVTAHASVGGNLAVSGDLDITGNINSYNVTDLDVTDQTITLGAGQTEALSGGSGIIIDGSSASILWDETNDVFDINKGLTTTGSLAVGTTSFNNNNKLHVRLGDASLSSTSNQSVAVFENNNNAWITIGSTSTAFAGILFADADDTDIGQLRYDHNDNELQFITNTTQKMVIDSSGNVGIGTDSPGHKLSFGANIPSDGKTITVYEDGNIASGIGVVSGVYRNFTNETSALSFGHYAHSDGTTYTERMRILSDGKVSVGGQSSNQLLNVTSATTPALEFTRGSGNATIGIDNGSSIAVGGTAGDLILRASGTTGVTHITDSGGNITMTLTEANNVGIGTTNPLNKLSVVKSNTSNYYNRSDATAVIQDALPTLLIAHDGNSTNDYAELRLGNNQTTYYPYSAYIRGVQNSGIDRYRLEFGTSNFANATTKMTINELGNVGIGESNPQTKLHVYGTSPVIRVSDDGTTGYSTLELRQQNTATEGAELMYDSGTGDTHLNTVFNAGLKIATNTGSFGTTSTNTRLTVKNDGVIEVGKSNVSTDRIKFIGNTNVSAPSTSNHALGTRLSLFDSSTNSFYAIGIESNHMWFNADDGGSYKFYTRAVQKVYIDCSSPMPELRVGTDSTNAMTLGSVTAVFPYSGLSMIVATPGAALTVHNGTNSAGTWVNLHNSLNDYLRGTATFNTINTSQQANIIVYLNVATKVYLARQAAWNGVNVSGWTQISNSSTIITDNASHNIYVRYLPAGTHSLDNDSALYFFEAPIGP